MEVWQTAGYTEKRTLENLKKISKILIYLV